MHTPLLHEFIEPIALLPETTTVAEALRVLVQTGGEWAIAINAQHIPIGWVGLHQLLRCGSPDMQVVTSLRRVNTPDSWHTEASLNSRDDLLEPLGLVSISWPLTQVKQQLRANALRHWAVVDAQGHCLGVLNQVQFWQRLATNQPPDLESGSDYNTQLPAWIRSHTHADPIPFAPLATLLEELPLPLMLQTGSGQVITHNHAWREQLGGLLDPAAMRHEVAPLLERLPVEGVATRPSGHHPPADPIWQHLSPHPSTDAETQLTDSWESMAQVDDPDIMPHLCQISTETNTCVCICPMKDGQERVLKFVKIPLGSLTSSQALFDAASAATVTFHLAALEPVHASPQLILDESPALDPDEFLWLVLAQDTTEQQQVTKELAAKNADLLQLNRLKDEFLSCISHELKTPLTAVLGLSSLLKDQLVGTLNERQVRYAQLIHQSGRHLMLIVNDILDLTRIETGQLELTMDGVSLESACLRAYEQACQIQPVDHTTEPAERRTSAADLQFCLEIEPGLDEIMADEPRLRQMLTNLLSNAIKFTQPGGKIGLKVDHWDGWVAFTVWDTGIGIPADKQHLIFQKFQQLENPLTRRFEGTGLGLVLTQRLARLHGGDVTFTSIEGRGSRFTLLLPSGLAHWGAYRKAPQVKRVCSGTGTRLVLVVEAIPKFLDDLTAQLADAGYRVAIARSGTEALEKGRCLHPSAIFLNPLLPLLSGWDVLTLLKSTPETVEIPVILTGTRADRGQALSNGASGFLALPIRPDELHQTLTEIENQHQQVSVQEDQVGLTILHLWVGDDRRRSPATAMVPGQPASERESSPLDLARLLYPYPCRVLEVDDLDQADLLARVWKPHVILLEGKLSDPFTYIGLLSQQPALGVLPLVTTSLANTQAANQVKGITVYPCLDFSDDGSVGDQVDVVSLLEVMRIAAGIC